MLSDRIRAGCEAAPWVVEEVGKLESELADLRARLEKAEKDAERLHAIRELCGCVEDGSAQTVRIFQDDATKDWAICFGQHGREFARSFEAAIDAAIAKEKQC